MASASAGQSPAGISMPVSSVHDHLGNAVHRRSNHGLAAAMASTSTLPNGSRAEQSTTTSLAARIAGMSCALR
jgi:hypothetical protein